jgi:hypothetical protein
MIFSAKIIKTEYIPNNGIGQKIMLKPFGKGQPFAGMIGYCSKDEGLHHFAMVGKGVTKKVCIIFYKNLYIMYLIMSYVINVNLGF